MITPDLKNTKRQCQTPAHSIDRLPPHSAECERGVLGCCLLDPKECIADCVSKIKSKDVFYDLRHQTIYDCLVEMFEATPAGIDIITLQQRLKDAGKLDQIGGIPYLSELQDAVPSAANLDYYLEYVIEKWKLRRIIQTCTTTIGCVYDFEGEVDTFIDQVEKDMLALTHVDDSTARKLSAIMPSAIDKIETQSQNPNAVTGLSTGFPDLDVMTTGLHPGEMIVIAARPSLGKTSLAMNIAENVALAITPLPVGIFSLEMTAEALLTRSISSVAKVNLRTLNQNGMLNQQSLHKIMHASNQLNASPIWIDDTAGLSILQLRARARRMAQQFGIKLFIIDYMQLLHSTSRKAQDNRQQEIADISAGCKGLAKELKVPVIVLSQLNREVEKDKGRKPRLSDLRESGAIEQDADLVGLLYRPNDDDPDSQEQQDAGESINLLIAKQRNGPIGDVHLTFLRPYTRFESASQISDEDVPCHQAHFPDP
jgi:replicative DNA helicase